MRTFNKCLRLAAPAALCLLLTGCGEAKKAERVFSMGEPVAAGPLTYTVLETDWKSEAGTTQPKHRLLLVRLRVTNSGGAQEPIPALTLEDSEGRSYVELADIEGIPDTLGVIRTLPPAHTEQGVVVFDVNPGAYRLRVKSEAGDTEQVSALIQLPSHLENAVPLPSSAPTGGVPALK